MAELLWWMVLSSSLVLAQETEEDLYAGLTGVGNGTLVVIIVAIFAGVVCFFKDASYLPNCIVFFAALLPLTVLIVIFLLPKESLTTDTTDLSKIPTDNFMIRTIAFFFLIFLFFVASILAWCNMRLSTVSVRRIDSEVGNTQESMFATDSEIEESNVSEKQ
jgi:hypothetical protein